MAAMSPITRIGKCGHSPAQDSVQKPTPDTYTWAKTSGENSNLARHRSNNALPMHWARDFCLCFQAVEAHTTCWMTTSTVASVCIDRVNAFGVRLGSCWHTRTLGWNKSPNGRLSSPAMTSSARRSFLASFHN